MRICIPSRALHITVMDLADIHTDWQEFGVHVGCGIGNAKEKLLFL
jgi:hypothetical protein